MGNKQGTNSQKALINFDWENEIKAKILKGIFDHVPPSQANSFRIYLCSTFTDFVNERNYVMKSIYPYFRKFCLEEEYNLDFRIVDLKWGIEHDEFQLNETLEIYLEEIRKCKMESIGPCFIAFLGHCYGDIIIKPQIDESEFNLIKNEIEQIKMTVGTDEWLGYKNIKNLFAYVYELDTNELPKPIYKLKSIPDIISGLNIADLNKEDMLKEWLRIKDKLLRVTNLIIDSAYKKNLINEQQRQSYFTTLVEKEMEEGILFETNDDEYINNKCFVMIREISDLDDILKIKAKTQLTRNLLKQYSQNDFYSIKYLQNLKEKVYKAIERRKIFQLPLTWSQIENVDLSNMYLKEFEMKFTSMIAHLINLNIQTRSSESNKFLKFKEILHHACLCNNLVKRGFYERNDLINSVNKYIMDETNTKPFIIFGESGSGKSTLMANIVKSVRTIKKTKITVIIRFLGTTKLTTKIKCVYKSIINQIKYLNDETNGELDELNDSQQTEIISDLLLRELQTLSTRYPNEKFLILLDSIDQLKKSDLNLDWILYDLPKNIKIIYSTLGNYENTLERIKSKLIYSNENYLEIRNLFIPQSVDILKSMLNLSNRTLTDKQFEALKKCLNQTNEIYPLHLKLLFDLTYKWQSTYEPDKDLYNCVSIKKTIKYLFRKLERKHGKIIFSKCIFYLTIFKNGISENELEDVLSVDDQILQVVYANSEENLKRFPYILWLRIKYDLKDYLIIKETDNLNVITWYHRSFFEAAEELYYEELFKLSDRNSD